ncbi:THO complex protein 7 [Teleopsis dalmanni]|uniref:THO complex protein 7 n=1 Tax=Teleopsis dalmanni TaxID=139649 RepID=UPI0018CD3858|nr:THO complex protein 7 [Teleopsis dalmanni]
MGDEDIIKQRLIIDGDGTGDDRRINMLMKQFLKWSHSKNDSPDQNQIIFERLVAQLAQCKLAAEKSAKTSKMIEKELANYQKLSKSIEESISNAKQEIEDSKIELTVAQQIRKNKLEYDMLAKLIKEQPDRIEITQQIAALKKELTKLLEKKTKLELKFQKRRNDFTILMYAIHELEAQLKDDELLSNSSKSDEEDDDVISENVDISDDEDPESLMDIDKQQESSNNDDESSKEIMSVDEDAVLELSIDRELNDVVKIDELH